MIETDNRLMLEIKNVNFAGVEIENKAYYEMILHTDEYDFPVKHPNEVDVIRDYNSNVCEIIIVDFNIALGDFVKHIYPKRTNLKATLINKITSHKIIIRYDIIITEVDDDIKNGIYNTTHQDDLNKKDPTRVTIQCINETISELRTKTVNGIHKKTDVGTIMGINIQEALNKTTFSGTVQSKGVKMTKPNNDRAYNHVIVPDGTSLLDLPSFFQDGDAGVFNGGLGSFLQSDGVEELLHIFPLYRPNNEDKTQTILKVLATNEPLSGSIQNTYTVDEDYVTIVADMGDSKSDLDDITHTNAGVGFEGVESDAMMRRPVEVTIDRVKSSKEWIKRKHIHKEVSNKAYKTPNVGATNNWYTQRSKVLKNDGKAITINWERSNIYHLKPGMFVEFFTLDHDSKVIKYIGTLQGVHAVTSNTSETEKAVLNIFLVNYSKGEKL